MIFPDTLSLSLLIILWLSIRGEYSILSFAGRMLVSMAISIESVALLCVQFLLYVLLDYVFCRRLFVSNDMYLFSRFFPPLPLLLSTLVFVFRLLFSYVLSFQSIYIFVLRSKDSIFLHWQLDVEVTGVIST